MMSKRGRPPKPEGERVSRQVLARVTEQEYGEIDAAAVAAKLHRSAWARRTLVEGARRPPAVESTP